MSSVIRDRGARTRIREYLAANGPIDDSTGRATAELKEAIDYQGSAVAFIQLIAAMDRDGEIVRDIRGKRTYGIASASAPAGAKRTSVLPAASGAPLGVPADLDYDKLARALLREVARAMSPGAGEDDTDLKALVDQRNRLQAERDEYAERLEAARRQLSTILGDYAAATDSGTSTERAS